MLTRQESSQRSEQPPPGPSTQQEGNTINSSPVWSRCRFCRQPASQFIANKGWGSGPACSVLLVLVLGSQLWVCPLKLCNKDKNFKFILQSHLTFLPTTLKGIMLLLILLLISHRNEGEDFN